MAKCPYCGVELINGSIFCGVCGARVPEGTFDSMGMPADALDVSNVSNLDNASTINDYSVDSSVNDNVSDESIIGINTDVVQVAPMQDGDQIIAQGQPIGGSGKAPSIVQINGKSYGAYVPDSEVKTDIPNDSNRNVEDVYSQPIMAAPVNMSNMQPYGYQNNNTVNGYGPQNYNQNNYYNAASYTNTPTRSTNSNCVVSMILGIFSLVSCGFCGVTSIIGLILGIIGVKKIDETGEGGRGMGIAGIVLNGLAVLGGVFIAFLMIIVGVFDI